MVLKVRSLYSKKQTYPNNQDLNLRVYALISETKESPALLSQGRANFWGASQRG